MPTAPPLPSNSPHSGVAWRSGLDQKAQSGALKLGFEPNRGALRLRPAKSGYSGKPLATKVLHHRNPKPKTMGVTHYGYRYYDPNTGRWPSRDPIEERGGMNLYGFVNNDGVNRWDTLGLYTLPGAEQNLRNRGVKGEGGLIPGGAGAELYTRTQVFDEWLRLELADAGWLNDIPDCPDKICVKGGEPKDCDNGEWNGLGEASQTFHPGAKWCMRSKEFGDSAQQCCYDENGDLMTDLPAAGTPDRVASSFWNGLYGGHYSHDVQPYNLAETLGRVSDYGKARPPSQGGGSCYKK